MIMKQRTKGIFCLILAAFFFTCMNLAVRASGDLPSVQKSFFRNFVAMFFALILLLKDKTPLRPEKGCLLGLVLRSAFGTIGILCNFYAVDHLVLADATILNKLSPFAAAFFSVFLLKERIHLKQALIILTAFIGSLFVIKPSFTDFSFLPALIGLTGGICAGIAYTFVRYLTKKGEKKSFIVFFFSAFSCAVTLPSLILNFHPMSEKQLLILLLAGLFAAGGQFSITAAYSYAPAREISVYDYMQVFFAAVLGFLFFAQIPDILSVLGYIIIITAGLSSFLISRKEPQ